MCSSPLPQPSLRSQAYLTFPQDLPQSKMPKELSSPSRSNAVTEQQCINEQIDDKIEQCQRKTRNIRKPGDVGNSNFNTFTQNYSGLISLNSEIPASAYWRP